MGGITLVLVIGVLNLGLGYALGVSMGYRPTSPVRVRQTVPAAELCQVQSEEPSEITLDDLIHELISGGEEPSAWDEESAEAQDWEDTFDPDGKPESSEAQPPPEPDEATADGRLLSIRGQVDKHLEWLLDLDTRLRQSAGEHDLFSLLAWVQELKEGCQLQQGEASGEGEGLVAQIEGLPELGESGQALQTAASKHAARLQQATQHPDQQDIKRDPDATVAWLIQEIDRVQHAAHELRDSLEEAFLAAVGSDDRLHAIDPSLRIDPLTQFPNRVGLETILLEWREAGGSRTRPLSVALFDLDSFAEVNCTHGLQVSDGVVRASAECIGNLAGENEVIARFGGKRLLLAMFDVAPEAAAERAELIRQSIGKTRFAGDQAEIHVTLSAGVAAALPEQPPGKLLRSLKAALAAAKEAGRNCSFLHDGRGAERIEAPDLDIEPRKVFV